LNIIQSFLFLHKNKILKVYHNIKEVTLTNKTVVTLGTFDGVHKGHQAILKRLVAISQKENLESIVLTFFPHPRKIVSNQDEIKLLNTIHERTALLEKNEIDHFVIHPFDVEFANLSPLEFVEQVLVKQFNVRKIIIGHDHKFGKNRAANFHDLIDFGKQFGFEVEEISAQVVDEVSVSSTKIRNALFEGNVALANEFLGYQYTIQGTVEKGNQLGRTINFPTANLAINEDYKLIPKIGVYAVEIYYKNQKYFGMMNIGMRPTINGLNKTIEVHVFDFNKNIYGEKLIIKFVKKIREEQKFESFEQLKEQLERDKKTTINLFRN